MNEMQQAAYVMAQAACAQVEAMGMKTINDRRLALGEELKYYDTDFERLIEKYGIHHNAVIELFHGRT